MRETRHSAGNAEEREGPKPGFLIVEEQNDWNDERAVGYSKRFSSATAGSEGPRRTLLRYIEDLNGARTKPGKRCVLARRGWAGEKGRLFQHPA